MRKFILLPIFLFLLSSSALSAVKRVYPCYRLIQEPVLDGKLKNDPAWENIPQMTGFIKFGSNSLASKQTSFRICYTSEAIYIGIECEEPEIEKIKAKSKDEDTHIFSEDSIEIFLFPKEADNYYQFVVNAIGSRWNGIGLTNPKIPLGNWQAKVYQGKDYYSVEIKIPFEIFSAIPEKVEKWTGNICRNIYTCENKYTTWAYVKAGFHEPEHFGEIVFMDKSLSIKDVKKIEKEINLQVIKEKVELLSCWEISFRKANKNPSMQKKAASILKAYKEIEKLFSSNTFSLNEMDFIFKNSESLFKEADELRGKILLQALFD